VRARPFAVQLSTLERLVKYNEFRATSLIVDRLRKKSELRRSQSQTKVGARMRIASARLRMERAAMATLKVIHSEGLSPTINRPARAAAVAKLEAIARMPITCVAAAPMFPPTPPNDQRLERSAVGAVATINAERTLRESHVRHIQAAVRKMRARRRVSLDMHASLQAKMRDRLFLESEAMRAAGLLQRAWLSALAQRTEMEVQVEVHDAAQAVERNALMRGLRKRQNWAAELVVCNMKAWLEHRRHVQAELHGWLWKERQATRGGLLKHGFKAAGVRWRRRYFHIRHACLCYDSAKGDSNGPIGVKIPLRFVTWVALVAGCVFRVDLTQGRDNAEADPPPSSLRLRADSETEAAVLKPISHPATNPTYPYFTPTRPIFGWLVCFGSLIFLSSGQPLSRKLRC